MFDVVCSLVLLAVIAAAGAAFAVHRVATGSVSYHRVDQDGGSALLGKGALGAGYWVLQPVGRLCIAVGLTPNAVTLGSLALGLAAGVALGAGWFGLGALLAALGFAGDALDGLVARATGVASEAGEVVDAAADRWGEFAFIAGVVVAYRAHLPWLLLALAAQAGAFMVSYATAKAEALRVEAPRGSMRRVERAVYLTLAAMLTPFTATLAARHGMHPAAGQAPMLAALALVGVVGNVSAVRRLAAVAAVLRGRVTPPPGTGGDPAERSASGEGATEGEGGGDGQGQARHGVALLLRHQAGSLASTVADFGTMILAVELAGAMPAVATAFGATAGAVTNFTLGRRWIFRGVGGGLGAQALRYAVVSGASLGLNTAGEYVLAQRLAVPYVLARLGVAVAVSLLWNFPMQRWFVFGTAAEADG